MQTIKKYLLPFLFIAAFLIRVANIPNPGFVADIAFWKSWGIAPFDHGIVWSIFNTNNNYPTPFAYLLWVITSIYSLFANPHIFNEYWNQGNTLYLTLIKLPAILADLGIAAIIYWFTTHIRSEKKHLHEIGYLWGLILASLYLFNPIAIFDSSVWGQVDSLGVFLFLVAVICVIKKKPGLAGFFYMVGLMTKLQTMIYAPLFFLFVWQMTGFPGLIRSVIGSTLAFFGLNIEFLLTRNMGLVITSLITNYDYFPLMSLNAYNLWWIVAGANGMQTSDKLLTIGIINAKTSGLLLFSGTYLLAMMQQLKSGFPFLHMDTKKQDGVSLETREWETVGSFVTGLIIVVFGFFLLQTESHDRYAFPIIAFGCLWVYLFVRDHLTTKDRDVFWTTRIFRYSIIGYILFTGIYFLNVHTAFVANYAENGIQWLLFLNTPFWTIAVAYLLLASFIVFLIVNRKTIPYVLYVITGLVLITSIVGLNLPFMKKQPVSLTKLSPPIHEQQYGVLTTNMPVNARADNSKTWDRLSTQYMFYKKGLGTHAKSRIVYDIGKRFTRFTTDMGIDTEAGPQASVVFEIYGDNTLLYRSPVVKRFDYPVHADVPVVGVKNLTLIVDDAGNGNFDDHADWLNPLLYP